MLCHNTGVLSGSHHYHFVISKIALQHYYHIYWCGHFFCDRDYSIQNENFPVAMIAYIRSGTLNIEYKGHSVEAHAGMSVIIDLTSNYRYFCSDYVEFLFIGLAGVNTFDIVNLISNQQGLLIRENENYDLEKKMVHLVSAFQTEQEFSDVECSRMGYDILCEMAIVHPLPSGHSDCINEIIDFIRHHLDQKLSLEKIADQAKVSPYHFSRIFKKETGLSPMEYVTKLRLKQAIYLLKTTELPINEIASSVGYDNYGSFINRFTESIGVSPRKFRKYNF